MANNLQIFVHRDGGSLHLKLVNDFDRNSVYKLLGALERNCHGVSRVYIYTSCLKEIFPLDRNVFQKKLDILKSKSISVAITGESASKLAPEENYLYQSIWA
ncbi:MAG TPA: hypothetical protein ENF70_01320 [Deltaproteobacteria bacterium]|nr:hypothetical protein [Deltaproteobacteria bacterium]HDH97761.1 hypothetical protein [Deltaproteobacteria bacterium]